MRRVADWGTRKDANHNLIVRAYEALKCRVKEVHMVPNFVDLIVKCGGCMGLVEVKDPAQPPSNRKLSEGERTFWEYWGEEPVVIMTVGDVEEHVNKLRRSGL